MPQRHNAVQRARATISATIDDADDRLDGYELRMESLGGSADGHTWTLMLDESEARVFLGIIAHAVRRRADEAGVPHS
jgi:hypothetical protein